MPSPASSPAIRRYPQCSLSAAMRSTRRTTWRWVSGRPGLFGLDLAAQRRRTISRCQRRIVPGVMNECSAPWRERGMSVSSAANSARSVHVSLGRAAVCRCRTASWWRSRRISASFHAGGRLDSLSHAGIWTARRNTKRRHTSRDHRPPGCLTASRQHPDDLSVRGFRQPHAAGSAGEGAQVRGHDKGCAHLVFPNLITHVATTDATVTGNQMTTAICEDLTRQNLAPGRSYLDSGYLSAAVVVSALTTRAAPGSLEGCDLWESRDSWRHGSSIPRGLSGRARVAMFRPDNSPRTAAMGAAGRRVAARPVIGRPKPTWTAGTCPDSAGRSSPVALAYQPSGGLPGCKVPEPGGGAVTGGLSQRRM